MKKQLSIEEITNFSKRKGFVFPSGEIYGGLAGFWDFGPLGVELKNNIKNSWWKFHVQKRDDVVGLDGSIITNPKVWHASGHADNFIDLAVECKKCKNKAKIDKHELKTAKCEKCNGELISKGEFNPMFITNVGPIQEESITSFLRPETAQLIFSNFKQITDTSRVKLPFGIAQIGKSFRNEIAPRNFLFRCREFEQMEIEYFINPKDKNKCPYEIPDIKINILSSQNQESNKEMKEMSIKEALKKGIIKLPWHAYWLATEISWFKQIGCDLKNFRLRQHTKEEKSHYATDTWDIEYKFSFGYKELIGIADRGNYDLTMHQKHSNKNLEMLDESTNKKFLPLVISEPSLGVERVFLVLLLESYSLDKKDNIILKLNPKLSPYKVSVLPLIKKDEKLTNLAKKVHNNLKENFNSLYDESGSIGRRYARSDEIGTPYCVTIDFDTINDNSVTVRFRDDQSQKRVKIDELEKFISSQLIES